MNNTSVNDCHSSRTKKHNNCFLKLLSILICIFAITSVLCSCNDTSASDMNSIAEQLATFLDYDSSDAISDDDIGTTDTDNPSADSKLNSDSEDITYDASSISESSILEDGIYTTKEDVSFYIYTYKKLPSNFLTKNEARDLGWSSGSLEDYAPSMCIGGDSFGNFEGLLPTEDGRKYYECDINTLGAQSRGAERIVYSNDGLIYYTNDHYASFELLYGEE